MAYKHLTEIQQKEFKEFLSTYIPDILPVDLQYANLERMFNTEFCITVKDDKTGLTLELVNPFYSDTLKPFVCCEMKYKEPTKEYENQM